MGNTFKNNYWTSKVVSIFNVFYMFCDSSLGLSISGLRVWPKGTERHQRVLREKTSDKGGVSRRGRGNPTSGTPRRRVLFVQGQGHVFHQGRGVLDQLAVSPQTEDHPKRNQIQRQMVWEMVWHLWCHENEVTVTGTAGSTRMFERVFARVYVCAHVWCLCNAQMYGSERANLQKEDF